MSQSIGLPNEDALRLYADDTAVIAVGDDAIDLHAKMQDLTDGLCRWCQQSRLSIHIGKSKVMYFNTRNVSNRDILHVTMDGTELEQVAKYKYLGFIIGS